MSAPSSDPIVAIEALSHGYAGRDRAFELRVPSLHIAPGRFHALVGPSGSGKSTLLDILALVRRPQKAADYFFTPAPGARPADVNAAWRAGDDATLADLRRIGVGYVLQSGGLLPFLSVAENVSLPIALAGARPDPRATRRLLGEFGMEAHADKRVERLSGGERQRVAIARALAHRPVMVLADEPTAAVDRDLARAIVEALATRARQAQAAVVMVTHDEAIVDGVADVKIRFVRAAHGARSVRYEIREERR